MTHNIIIDLDVQGILIRGQLPHTAVRVAAVFRYFDGLVVV